MESKSLFDIVPSVLVSGVFNITHPGHVKLFEFASKFGNLTVAINGDIYCRKKYGDRAVSASDRLYVISSIRYVKSVIIFEEDEPSDLIYRLKPDIYVRGPDYKGRYDIPEMQAIKDVGCDYIILDRDKDYGTSSLMRIRQNNRSPSKPYTTRRRAP